MSQLCLQLPDNHLLGSDSVCALGKARAKQWHHLQVARCGSPERVLADRFSATRLGRLRAQSLGKVLFRPQLLMFRCVRFCRLLPSEPQASGRSPLRELMESDRFLRIGKLPDSPHSSGISPCSRSHQSQSWKSAKIASKLSGHPHKQPHVAGMPSHKGILSISVMAAQLQGQKPDKVRFDPAPSRVCDLHASPVWSCWIG